MEPKVERLREATGELATRLQGEELKVELDEENESISIVATDGVIYSCHLKMILVVIDFYNLSWFISREPLRVYIY